MYIQKKLGKSQNSNLHANTFECEFFFYEWKLMHEITKGYTVINFSWYMIFRSLTSSKKKNNHQYLNVTEKKNCFDVDKLCESLNWLYTDRGIVSFSVHYSCTIRSSLFFNFNKTICTCMITCKLKFTVNLCIDGSLVF